MLPFSDRTVDTQYRDRLRLILEQGELIGETQQGVGALTYMAPPPMHFDLSNGVPLITERKIPFWKAAVGELLAFANGVRTQKGLEEFGCSWWDKWLTAEKCAKRGLEAGDLGPGGYAAMHDFPTAEGNPFNQIKHLVEQISEKPQLRTHFVSPWVPQYVGRGKGKKQRVVVAPCHGWMHVRIIPHKGLVLHMFQRSADFPVGVPANMIQYAAFTLALAHVTGHKPYKFIHSFSDAHIYVDQVEQVKEMLSREPRRFPTMTLNTDKKDIFAIRSDDFVISDYDPHPGIREIPVAV
ncbi:MAG TPA: thymidylate synthase [Parcubacteria group bacterium]|nr:thymidylate synthase [Parcubacteria group bacterium]